MRAVLAYHSLDGSGSPVSVPPATFRRQMEWLAAGPVRVVPLEALPELPEDGGDAVAVTFDDAFASFATEAWPVLRDLGLPATLFVPTARAGRDNRWDAAGTGTPAVPVLPLLGWRALERLAAEGVALGAHTATHPDLRGLPPDRLEEEVDGSADRLRAATGADPAAFAYPFGLWDAAALDAVRRRFRVAVTTELRPLRAGDDPHLLPRLDAFYLRRTGRLEQWGTPRFRRHLWLRGRLRRARRLIRGIRP